MVICEPYVSSSKLSIASFLWYSNHKEHFFHELHCSFVSPSAVSYTFEVARLTGKRIYLKLGGNIDRMPTHTWLTFSHVGTFPRFLASDLSSSFWIFPAKLLIRPQTWSTFIMGIIRYDSGLILGLRSANGRRRYFVMTSLIGWAQA